MSNNWFMRSMEKISSVVEEKITPPLIKIGSNKFMVAIRASLVRLIPMLIIGSIPMIFTNLPVESWAAAMAPYNDALNTLSNMTFGFMSLFLSISIGVEFAKIYKIDATMTSIITAACFIITVAPLDLENNVISAASFGSSGMFTAFVIGIVVAIVMHLCDKYNIGIRMPKSVPAGISSSFAALVPMAILFIFFWFLRIILGFELNVLLQSIISPILILSDTWYAVLIVALVLTLLWFVGIHGGSMTVQGVMYVFLFSNIALNAEQVAAGQAPTHVLTEPFVFTFGMPTGVAITLPLILIWFNSKSKRLRSISRLSLVPGIFNINEPMTFGTPLIMNPIMFIPFVFGTTTLGMMYGYVLIRLGLITAPYIQVPWTTPILIQPYLATAGDWRIVVAQLILLIVVAIIWYPFAKMYEKQLVEQESNEENSTLEAVTNSNE